MAPPPSGQSGCRTFAEVFFFFLKKKLDGLTNQPRFDLFADDVVVVESERSIKPDGVVALFIS